MKKYLVYLECEGELKPVRIETDNFHFFILEDKNGERHVMKDIKGCVCCGIIERKSDNG